MSRTFGSADRGANKTPSERRTISSVPRGAPGQYVAVRHGYEVKLEHVRDPRAEFYLATIHRLENGVYRYWGVVGESKEQALTAAAALVEERLSLQSDRTSAEARPAVEGPKSGRTQVA